MTLVLSVLAREYVFLVADRRITDLRSGGLIDDSRNKVTQYDMLMAFAYSGLAHIDGEKTDLWIAKVMAEAANLNDAVHLLADRATQVFSKMKVQPEIKRQAFVAVGWGRPPNSRTAVPGWVTVSNALDDQGRWLQRAKPLFEIVGVQLSQEQRWWLAPPIGASLEKEEISRIRTVLRPAFKRRLDPLVVIHALSKAIRSVASRNRTVGQSLIGVVVPLASIQLPWVRLLAQPLGNTVDFSVPVCFDLDAQDQEFRWVLPNISSPGQVIADARASGTNKEVSYFGALVSPPKPGSRAGIVLTLPEEEVFFGVDEFGTPFKEVRKLREAERMPTDPEPEKNS